MYRQLANLVWDNALGRNTCSDESVHDFVYYMFQILTVIKRTARPDESWGPAAPKHRIGTRYDEANRIDTFPGVALDHPITNSVYSLPPPSYPDYIERTAAASEGGGDTATDQTYL